jgi:serine/threonine protein kinase
MTSQSDETRGAGRFHLRRRIGSGGFGIVYEAFDTKRNAVVALKTLRAFDAKALQRFKHEFRTLADVDHVHLVSLFELFGDGDEWFFTMELVDGVPLVDYVWSETRHAGDLSIGGHSQDPTSDLPARRGAASDADASGWSAASGDETPAIRIARVDRLRSVMRQLAEGVCAMHRAAILHRDLKPSNVLVRPDGLVVVLDFGLATELSSREFEGRIVGTPAYMSPEQASGRPVEEASDWYSVGVMLYEGLTGVSPFRGRTSEVLLSKQLDEPPPPHTMARHVPDDLDRLCQDLLRRDPYERPSGSEVLRRLTGEPGGPPQAETAARVLSTLVGRDGQIAALLEAHARTSRDEAVIACIEGRSGMGKSVLARRFLNEVRRRNPQAVVLSGRCYEQESVPYKAIDGVIDELARMLADWDPRELDAVLPRNIRALARLFPVLNQVGRIAAIVDTEPATDAQELRRRAFAALRELLRALLRRHPLILFIDDLHWGDIDSASLLTELLRPPDPPPLLLVLAYRSEERQSSAALNALLPTLAAETAGRHVQTVDVAELSQVEARSLASALLADRPDASAHAESIAQESGGSPFFVEELARHVAASGRVASLGDVLRTRVAELSIDARRMLELIALNSRPLDFEVGKTAADWLGDPRSILRQLRALHFVRTQADAESTVVEPKHDRIREAVINGLDAETRRSHHVRLANAWEASGRADPELLAVHYDGAGDPARAAENAERAAGLADETLAFDRAARLYRWVVSLRPDAGRSDLRPIHIKLAKSLANTGKGRLAAEAYLEAAVGAPVDELVELERQAAEQFLRVGDIDQGLEVIRRVLERIGMRLPMTSRGALPSMLFSRVRLAIRGFAYRERAESTIPPVVLARIDTCRTAALGMHFIDPLRGGSYHYRALLLALKTGEPFRVGLTLATQVTQGPLAGGRRRFAEMEAVRRRAMEIADRLDNDYLRALTIISVGVGMGHLGDHQGCLTNVEGGAALLRDRCVGAIWEHQGARVFMMESLFWMGEWTELQRRLPVYVQISEEASDNLMAAFLKARVHPFALLFANQPERARAATHDAIAQWSNQAFQLPHFYELYAQLYVDLYCEDASRGFERLKQTRKQVSRSLLMQGQKFRVEMESIRGRLALTAAVGGDMDMLRTAEQEARRLEGEDIPWAEGLASLLRAGVAATRGQRSEALTFLSAAERQLEACHMRGFLAAARRRRGELMGGDEGRELVVAADEWMTAQQVADPARVTNMLVPGRW